jgi:hypothetical protein
MREELRNQVVRKIAAWTFYLLLAAEMVWVFSLPVFPTQDGSMHLYYARIISSLLSGASVYSTYFYIQHILPPYSLHYYFLAIAIHVLPPQIAEKLLVCSASVLLAAGFRFFTKAAGDRTGVTSLAVLPLLFHQPLLMGFYNYSLALGIGFWAMAFWVRASNGRKLRDWLSFLVLTYGVMASHPVPLALLLVFTAIDLASRLLRDWVRNRNSRAVTSVAWRYRADVLFFALASLSAIYVGTFIERTQSTGSLIPSRTIAEALMRIIKTECAVGIFAGPGIATVVYRVGLCALVAVALWAASRGFLARIRKAEWEVTDLLLVSGVLMIVLYPWIPTTVSGGDYFADRLMIAAWLVCAASAAGAHMTPWIQRIAIGLSASFTVFVLCMAQVRIAPVAHNLAEMERISGGTGGDLGLLLCSGRSAPGLAFEPYWWSGASYFSRFDAILLNSPWLDSHYMMVAGKPPLMTKDYPKRLLDDPLLVTNRLATSTALKREYAGLSNLILVMRDPSSTRSPSDEIGTQLTELTGRKWSAESGSWFTVYRSDR